MLTGRPHVLCGVWLITALAIGLAGGPGGGVCWGGEAVRLYAGTARADITPPVGQSMGGYTSRLAVNSGACQGIHDPLFARVLALRQGDVSVAIVSVDLLFFSSARVVAEAKRQWGVGHVILASSHTHDGPIPHTGGMTNWSNLNVNPTQVLDFAAFSQDPWYAATEDKVIAAIGEACRTQFPARVASGSGLLNSYYMSYSRRHLNTNGTVTMWWTNTQRLPSPPTDPTVGVIKISDDAGQPRALLVNYACHPVILGDQNLMISADFPGAMAARVEEVLGPSCMPMYLQGAEGDQNPYDSVAGTNGYYRVQQAGRDLADEALRVAGTLTPRSEVSLAVRERVTAIPDRNRAAFPGVGIVTVMVGADTALVAIPGEPFVQHQMDLSARSPAAHTFLLGLAYGGSGIPFTIYLPTVLAAQQGGYGASDTTFLAPSAGDWLLDGAVQAIHELRGDVNWGAIYHVVPPGTSGTPVPPYASWVSAATNLADALALAQDGDTVLVSNGLYRLTGTVIVERAVAVRSFKRGGLDRDGTLLDGNYPNRMGRCVYLNHPDAVVDGFTITNGFVTGANAYGAGVYVDAGVLRNCLITGNTASNSADARTGGGGVYASGASSLISGCDIVANAVFDTGSTADGGGGVMLIGAQVSNSRIMYNRCPIYWSAGGGVNSSGGTLINCQIVSNTVADGYMTGGVHCHGNTVVRNCLIMGNGRGKVNASAGVGIGVAGVVATIDNCTIVKNAGSGVGAYYGGGNVYMTNTICSLNSDGTLATAAGAMVMVNCCVSSTNGMTSGSAGTFTNDPRFISAAGGNYRLSKSSPCLNSGTNLAWMADAVDLDGNRRINRGSGLVDRGCYEALYGDPGTLLMFR